jgi:hypothetical protein
MKNNEPKSNVDAFGANFAFLFVFLTVIIGTSAVLPVSVLQESGLIEGAEHRSALVESGNNDIQTGRYLKVPSRF